MMKVLFLLTILHLLVDGCCGAVLAAYALQEPNLEPIVYYFSLYTVLAFGLQGPVGWLLDKAHDKLKQGLALGTGLLVLGAVPQFNIALQAVLLGLGNCLFHVSGGSYVLRTYKGYSQLGLFVASGAIGLGLGLNSIVGVGSFVAATAVVTLLAIMKMGTTTYESVLASKQAPALPGTCARSPLQLWGCAVLLLSCVLLRGFGSGGGLFTEAVMLLPCTFALGKCLGGVVCDRIGYRRTVLLIFLLGFVGLQVKHLLGGLLFILASNMTMPLTLRLAHWCSLKTPGLMFGLAASCLVPGTLFKEYISFPAQFILVLQFLILVGVGYLLLKQEAGNVKL